MARKLYDLEGKKIQPHTTSEYTHREHLEKNELYPVFPRVKKIKSKSELREGEKIIIRM